MTTVLTQEIDRYNKLLKLIHTSMDQLKKAIKGLVVMSEALEDVYKAFMNNMVSKLNENKLVEEFNLLSPRCLTCGPQNPTTR